MNIQIQQDSFLKGWIWYPILLLVLLAPGIVWIQTSADTLLYLASDVPQGQFLYVLSKLLGLYAMTFLWLQVMSGLLGEKNLRRIGIPWNNTNHRGMGVMVLGTFLLHGILFISGVSLRNHHIAFEILVPDLFNTYYHKIISLGTIAAWILILVVVMPFIQSYIKPVWKYLHILALPALILVMVHSYLAGSESRVGNMPLFYGLISVSLFGAILVRVFQYINRK